MTMPKFESVARLIPVNLPQIGECVWARTFDEYSQESSSSNPYLKGEETPLYTADQLTEAYEAGKRDAIPGWISVDDRLPEPYDRNSRNFQGVLAFVKDDENTYGGYPMVLFYGSFEFIDDSPDWDHPDADEDGLIRRFGWHYERDSEGEYDSLIFDMNGKVTHWMPLPAAPKGEE